MVKKQIFSVLYFAISTSIFSQTTLNATGSSNTYALINAALAPNYDVIEVPDCGHTQFGNHIDEIFDDNLNEYVFRFHAHVGEDDDRCDKQDRQRTEIKTYDKSPDDLLGVEGETVVYKWSFKLDAGFQPSSSFTHLHQIKAVGGDESGIPKITLTARDKTPDDLELRYSENNSQTTILTVDLDPFKGNWVDVVETITYGEENAGGAYEILITNSETGAVLLEYSDSSIRMWNTDADFMRPKWGIYRSLNDASSLRDEVVLFNRFSIQEVDNSLSTTENIPLENETFYQDFKTKELVFSNEILKTNDEFLVYNIAGKLLFNAEIKTNRVSLDSLSSGMYFVKLKNERDTSKALKIIIN